MFLENLFKRKTPAATLLKEYLPTLRQEILNEIRDSFDWDALKAKCIEHLEERGLHNVDEEVDKFLSRDMTLSITF
jgi:hypothetical protein